MSEVIRAICVREEVGKEEVQALLFATWFHDFIYDPKSRDNEIKSAKVLRKFFPESSPIIDQAVKLIEFTKNHFLPQTKAEKIIADADLAILGSAAKSYRNYAEGVREEFLHVSDETFAQARTKFLNRILEVINGKSSAKDKNIFWFLQSIFVENARKNIASEIQNLKNRVSRLT